MEKKFYNNYNILDYDTENIDLPVLDDLENKSERYISLKKTILSKWSEVVLSKQLESDILEKEKKKEETKIKKKEILKIKEVKSLTKAFEKLIEQKSFLKKLDKTLNCVLDFKEKKTSKTINLTVFEQNINKFIQVKYNLKLPMITYVARGNENIICVYNDGFRFYTHLNILSAFLFNSVQNLISLTYEEKIPSIILLRQISLMLHLSSYFGETILHSLTLILENLNNVMPKLIYNLEFPELNKPLIISNIKMIECDIHGKRFLSGDSVETIKTRVQMYAYIDKGFFKIGSGFSSNRRIIDIENDEAPSFKIFRKETINITDNLPSTLKIDSKFLKENNITDTVTRMLIIEPAKDHTFDTNSQEIHFIPKTYLVDYLNRTMRECLMEKNL